MTFISRATVEHSSGVNGFLTQALRMPGERLFVAILTNSAVKTPPRELLAVQVAGLAIGKPYQASVAISVPAEELAKYTGTYTVDERTGWVDQLDTAWFRG